MLNSISVRRLLLLVTAMPLAAQTLAPDLSGLNWRMIGPFRGGRTIAAAGIASRAQCVLRRRHQWRSLEDGRFWAHLASDLRRSAHRLHRRACPRALRREHYLCRQRRRRAAAGSLGGRWNLQIHRRRTNAGAIWGSVMASRSPRFWWTRTIPIASSWPCWAIPMARTPSAACSDPTDGGDTWQKVLYKDENTGAVDLAFDPANPQNRLRGAVGRAAGPLGERRMAAAPAAGFSNPPMAATPGSSSRADSPLRPKGSAASASALRPRDPNRMYALVEAKPSAAVSLRRCGRHLETRQHRRAHRRSRLRFRLVRVDPKNKDVIYIANTSTYRSIDAGQTFTAIKGAPGGDDYHTIWINPEHPEIILLASDQGATITVNGGATWSSWYNQPTAQFYHVITDNQLSVLGLRRTAGERIGGSRQPQRLRRDHFSRLASGGRGRVRLRGARSAESQHHLWRQGDALRSDHRRSAAGRAAATAVAASIDFVRTMPLLFSAVDPHVLYLGSNVLLKTVNGGRGWDVISPDLTREKYDIPASVGVYTEEARKQATRRGVIYTIAPSHKDVNVIWAGTDDGLIHVTRDGGKSWNNVTPPSLRPGAKFPCWTRRISTTSPCIAAINRIRLDDLKPHIYRTHDGGKTWKEIVAWIAGSAGQHGARGSGAKRPAVRGNRTGRLCFLR